MRHIVAALFLFAGSASAGLVTNGTFDNNCASWDYVRGTNFCDTSGGNPTPALVLNYGGSSDTYATQDISGLVVGTTYEITLDATTYFNCCGFGPPGPPGVSVSIDGQVFPFYIVNNQGWLPYLFTFTYGGGSNTLRLSAEINGTDMDGEFDNVDIRPAGAFVPEPGTLLLLCGGLVALAGRWRRKPAL